MRPIYHRDYKRDIYMPIVNKCSSQFKIIGKTKHDNPIIAVKVVNTPGAPYIFVSGSVHGNEPIGASFLTQMLENGSFNTTNLNFVVIPCVNPDGYELNSRENANGVDLNRDFSDNPESEEVKAVQKYLKELGLNFETALDIHESGREESIDDDPAPDVFYMWEINENERTRLGGLVIDKLYKHGIPTCNWKYIFGDKNNNGIIYYPDNCFSTEYSSAKSFDVFMKKFYTDRAITTETAVHDTFEYRKWTLRLVLETIIEKGLGND